MIKVKKISALLILASLLFSACAGLKNGLPPESPAADSTVSAAAKTDTDLPKRRSEIDTVNPGVLTVGYTDIYVDGYLNQDETGPHGLDSELAGMIADELGLEIRWQLVPNEGNYFESIRKSLNGEKIDMFISVTNIQPDREKYVLFSSPYTTEGEDVAISFRKDNLQLKSAVDPIIEQLVSDGTVKKLKSRYVEPLKNIFETNNTMKLLSGIYFVQSRSIGGNEPASGRIDHVEIRYSKQWFGYDVRGSLVRSIDIDTAGYGKINGTIAESSMNPDDSGAAVSISFNPEELSTTGVAEMLLQVEGSPAESLSMVKVE